MAAVEVEGHEHALLVRLNRPRPGTRSTPRRVDQAVADAFATRAVKRLMLAELGEQDRTRVAEKLRVVVNSEDAKEGTSAIAEKRTPVWKGR